MNCVVIPNIAFRKDYFVTTQNGHVKEMLIITAMTSRIASRTYPRGKCARGVVKKPSIASSGLG